MGWLRKKVRGSVSVVGQDKGNGSQWPVRADLWPFPHDFSAAHSGTSEVTVTSPKWVIVTRVRRGLAALVVTLAAMAALITAGRYFQLRITLTDSFGPAGIYHLIAVPAGRGALVAACLPVAIARTGLSRGYLAKGDCPAGAEPVAKVIGALPGDVVELEPGFVAVNGMKFPSSQTAARDSAGRPLAHVLSGAYRVGAGEVWLFGFNNRRSWDARYFGAVPKANLLGVLGPVVTW
jgi:conjugative transfer signal peptidase TraF